MVKVHWIRDANVGPTKIITHCGKEGWKEAVADEFTDGSNIFEAIKRLSQVTCKRCLKSAERIARDGSAVTRPKLSPTEKIEGGQS